MALELDVLVVPKEIAVELKAIGYDRVCLGYYNLVQIPYVREGLFIGSANCIGQHNSFPECASAPLYQQVVDWFRVHHKIVLDVYQEFDEVNSRYTGNWVIDVSRLNDYKEVHELVVDETPADYYEALTLGITKVIEWIKKLQENNV